MQGAQILRNEAYIEYVAVTRDEAQRRGSRFSTVCHASVGMVKCRENFLSKPRCWTGRTGTPRVCGGWTHWVRTPFFTLHRHKIHRWEGLLSIPSVRRTVFGSLSGRGKAPHRVCLSPAVSGSASLTHAGSASLSHAGSPSHLSRTVSFSTAIGIRSNLLGFQGVVQVLFLELIP